MNAGSITIGGTLVIPTGAQSGYVLTSDTNGNASWGSTSSLVGPQGTQGRQGSTGATGTQGNQGVAGANGTQGNQGVAGSGGTQGNQGVAGANGTQGNQGVAGANGTQGNQGVAGSGGTQGNQGTAGVTVGLRYTFSTATTTGSGGTSSGGVTFNNATYSSVTAINLNKVDRNSVTLTNVLNQIKIGTIVQVSYEAPASVGYVYFQITSITSNTNDITYGVTFLSATGTTFTNGQAVSVDFGVQGPQGNAGSNGTQGNQGVTGSGTQGNQGVAGTNGTQGNQGIAGSGTAAGSTTQIQYNNGGAFAGSANLTWDNGNTRLGVGVSPGLATLDVQGGVRFKRTVVSSTPYSVLTTDYLIAVTGPASARTINLPAASTFPSGQVLVVSDESGNAATNNITINRNGSDTIEGGTSKVINTNYGAIRFYSDGSSKWFTTIEIGNQGFQGVTGSGTQGVQGVAGANGTQGNQGVAGTGTQGNQGVAGSNGTQGNQGVTGSGTQGNQGVAGSNGTQGNQGIAGSGTAAGSTTQIQYNNGGAFAGSANLTWDNGNTRLGIGISPGLATLDVQGGVRYKRTVVSTTPYSVLATDYLVAVTGPASARTINLPAATSFPSGQVLVVSDESGNAATNNITINRNGTDTIEGGTSKVINTNYGAIRFYSDGSSKWFTTIEIGNQGFQGVAGSNGTQGNQGVAGTNGTQGVAGTQGNQGVTGAGTQGVQGATGAQGGSGNLSIGATTISGGTPGSTLFVGTSSFLQQDNSNYFWDNTNKRLGIGTSAPQAALDVQGGMRRKRTAPATGAFPYTALLTDSIIAVTDTTAARTINLPAAASTLAGFFLTVSDESGGAGTNNITISRAGSDTIEGATSFVINKNYGAVTLYSDGTSKWFTKSTDAAFGTQGFQGVAGTNGTQGVTGTQGVQGIAGTNGTQGNQGVAGTGTQGNQGVAGSGTAAGSTTQIQYNNGGAFAGSANLTWDNGNTRLGIGVSPGLATLDVQGGVRYKRTVVSTTPYSVLTTDYLIAVTGPASARAINLPAASTFPSGQALVVSDESGNAATNNITINRNGTDTIEGGTSKVINTNYGAIRLYSNGSNTWFTTIEVGNQGFQGATGSGTQGVQGVAGSNGTQGNQGVTGTGTQGTQGTSGVERMSWTLGLGQALATGTDVTAWLPVDRDCICMDVHMAAKTAPTGSSVIIDILRSTNQGTSFTSLWNGSPGSRPTLSASSKYSITSSFVTNTLNKGDLLRIDIIQVGSTVAGQDLTVQLSYAGVNPLGPQGFQGAAGSGGGVTMGTTVATGGTTGSVMFVGASSVFQQDNANLFWDDTNNRLGLGTASPQSTLDVQGSIRFKRTVVSTTPYTILSTDNIVACTGPASARSYTLPSAASTPAGQIYIISDESGNAATNNITINRAGTDTIEGNTTKVISTNYGAVRLYSNGSNTWFTTLEAAAPGGSNTQVQYNNSGSFGGATNLVWDNTNSRLSIGNTANTNASLTAGSYSSTGDKVRLYGNVESGSARYGLAIQSNTFVAYTDGSTGTFSFRKATSTADPSGGTELVGISANGTTTISTQSTGTTGMQIRQNGSGQTANLLELTSSGGTTKLSFFGPQGYLRLNGTAAPACGLDVSGGVRLGRTAVSSTPYSLLATDYLVGVTGPASARTINLPAASAVAAGQLFVISDESGNAATNNITINRNGTDTIEGATSTVINTNYGSVKLYSDGTSKWFTTSQDLTNAVILAPTSSTRNTIQPTGDFKALLLKGSASQTANMMEVLNNGNTVMDCFGPQGYLGVGTNAPIATADIRSLGNSDPTLTARAGTGTADLFQALDSAGTTKHDHIGQDGRLYSKTPNSAPTDANLQASQITFYLDETNNQLKVRVKYANGTTLKTGTISLV